WARRRELGRNLGRTRIVELADGGSIRETVVSVDAPSSWKYAINDYQGPRAALVVKIDGGFLFASPGAGTRISWRYNMFPRFRLAASALPAVGWFWRGHGSQMLEELSNWLVD
ncbi:MAG: hypothetical protein QOG37_1575, partial [Mycobacterium sp.]|nr:hypothetical protein [Mycobacterium sp.]